MIALLVVTGSFTVAAPAGVGAAEPKGRPFMGEDDGTPAGSRRATSAAVAAEVAAATFEDTIAISGLTFPTAVRFASDGRVFVAEKSGLIKVFDSVTDTTPTTFADLRTNVDDYWDRGLLGLALPPQFPTDPYVYVLYTYDAPIGGTAPVWSDACPTPPGPTTNGCVVSGRLSRLQAAGNTMTGAEQVLINDWCQQFPSHSVGDLRFAPDGSLYLSAGDGASFTFADTGQAGNPCSDPSGEGGALRAQDLRTAGSGGLSYRDTVLADAPVAYWRLGETTGVVAADTAGTLSGWYGGTTVRGVPGAITGDPDGAVSFDGVSGHIGVPDYAPLDLGNGPWTVELWAKRNTTVARTQALIDRGPGSYQITFSGSTGKFTVGRNGAGVIARESGTTTDTAWHHFVVTKNGSAIRIYKDGVDVTSNTSSSTLTNSSTNLWFGRWNDSSVYGNVRLDEVAIYASVLSASRVAAHHQAATAGGAGASDPVTLDGSIIRVDPATGAALSSNPAAGASDPNARRIVAHGFRNPFRIAFRPGTSELWFGDVGWGTWEEIGRISNPLSDVRNFGWPCYEGPGVLTAYASTPICSNLYAAGASAVVTPYAAYDHSASVVAGDGCPTGSSAIAGLAFYAGGAYPDEYDGALFFADNSRDCIWAMMPGANGLPDPSDIHVVAGPAANPVAVEVGPGGDIFYVDFDGGRIHRIVASGPSNGAPTAVAGASPTSGTAPLAVTFDGSGSSDPDGDALTYAWDLDADGAFDDATGSSAAWTYASAGTVAAALRVTDPGGLVDIDSVTITVTAGSAPVPSISTPSSATTWAVGETIAFSGSAQDPEEGALPASALAWSLIMHHCPSNCHTHQVEAWTGVASGSLQAPDHEYPSYLELRLTATDASGASASTSVDLQPRTVDLSFASDPSGRQLVVNGAALTTPATRQVIVGSQVSLEAPSPQTAGSTTYTFSAWSDGGAASHQIVAPSSPTTYTATYTASAPTLSYRERVIADGAQVYWRLADTSGIVTADEVGTRTGWYGGGVTRGVAGALTTDTNAAVTLDGTSGYVGVPSGNAPSVGNGPFSIEFWVKRGSATGLHPIIDRGPGGYQIQFSSTTNKLTLAQNGTGNIVAETTTTTDTTTWHHFVITKDGSTVRIYRDGVDVTGTVTNRTLTNPTTNLWLGRWNDGTRYGRISLDEVAIYGVALSAQQVAAHYAAGRPPS
jgi:glucose/arabinose dehydrogenase